MKMLNSPSSTPMALKFKLFLITLMGWASPKEAPPCLPHFKSTNKLKFRSWQAKLRVGVNEVFRVKFSSFREPYLPHVKGGGPVPNVHPGKPLKCGAGFTKSGKIEIWNFS